MQRRHLLLAVLALAAFAAGPAEAKTHPVAPLDRATPVREYAGWLLYSRWDGSHYRLTAQRDGQTPARALVDGDRRPDLPRAVDRRGPRGLLPRLPRRPRRLLDEGLWRDPLGCWPDR
jgi:hypothetical protein